MHSNFGARFNTPPPPHHYKVDTLPLGRGDQPPPNTDGAGGNPRIHVMHCEIWYQILKNGDLSLGQSAVLTS